MGNYHLFFIASNCAVNPCRLSNSTIALANVINDISFRAFERRINFLLNVEWQMCSRCTVVSSLTYTLTSASILGQWSVFNSFVTVDCFTICIVTSVLHLVLIYCQVNCYLSTHLRVSSFMKALALLYRSFLKSRRSSKIFFNVFRSMGETA